MSISRAFFVASVALALTSVPFLTTSAFGQSPAPQADDPAPVPAANTASNTQPASAAAPQTKNDRYRDGMVIWETAQDADVPFLLKFNVNTQLRYLNTQDSDETYTDHLGVAREVHTRNDITVNRAMFILGGYVFDQRARYSFTVWTSAGAASIIVAGNIGWQFNRAVAITGGYTGVPGSRSLVATFPFFAATDRSMADNFFRPGFTQGAWANGEPINGLNYLAFVGNGLNTLSISANKSIRTCRCPAVSGGNRSAPTGNPVNHATCTTLSSPPTRFAFDLAPRLHDPGRTVSPNLDQSSPENTSLIQLRRCAHLLDRSVCARCHGRPGDV